MFIATDQALAYCKVSTADISALEADAAAACQMVEDACGPIATTTVTEHTWSTGEYCRLEFDVVSVTTVLDAAGGTVITTGARAVPGGLSGPLPYGWLDVTYVTGSDEIPDWASKAALAYTKWLWQGHAGPKSTGNAGPWKNLGDTLIAAHRLGTRP